MSPVTLLILLPLVSAACIALIPGLKASLARTISLIIHFCVAAMALSMFVQFGNSAANDDGVRFAQIVEWMPTLGIQFYVGLDPLNTALVLMSAVVCFAAVCCSEGVQERPKTYYVLLSMMTSGVIGAFASFDIFSFYFFHELALVPTFILIGGWGAGPQRKYATYKITLYLTAGALLALSGIIALYLQSNAGTFNMFALLAALADSPISPETQNWIFPLLLIGFGVLVSLWPLHTWAPLSYGHAPTGVAMIHAGALKKFGLYGLLRIAVPALPVGSENWMMVMVWLCLGNLILVGLAAMRQKQLHMLVGFSSVAHMGFIFMGLAVYNHIGVTGALLVMVAHGYLAALSFGVTGLLRLHHPDLDMSKMGGILKQAPYLGFALAVAFFAGCGVPGFANFAGEVLIFFGAWKGLPVAFVVPAIWSGLIIGGVYMLRAYRNVLHGPVGEKWANLKDPQGMPRIGCNVLIIALIFFGVMPSSITKMASPSIDALISQVEAGRPQATVMGSTSESKEIRTDISSNTAISAAHPTIASNTNP